jgi:hypothetical protein
MLSVAHTSGVVVTVTVTVDTVVSVTIGIAVSMGVWTFPQAGNRSAKVRADAMMSRGVFFINIFRDK